MLELQQFVKSKLLHIASSKHGMATSSTNTFVSSRGAAVNLDCRRSSVNTSAVHYNGLNTEEAAKHDDEKDCDDPVCNWVSARPGDKANSGCEDLPSYLPFTRTSNVKKCQYYATERQIHRDIDPVTGCSAPSSMSIEACEIDSSRLNHNDSHGFSDVINPPSNELKSKTTACSDFACLSNLQTLETSLHNK